MLMPKRIKWRKPHRRKSKGVSKRGNTLSFGQFGLKALESCWITARQIEAARISITRHVKRGGKVWIRIFPDQPVTKKPAETRMGKGKGMPLHWVSTVRRGKVVFELGGVNEELAREVLRFAASKLSFKTRFITRR